MTKDEEIEATNGLTIEEHEAFLKLRKALNKLGQDEAQAMTDATERVKVRYAEKREKLLAEAPEEVVRMLGGGGE